MAVYCGHSASGTLDVVVSLMDMTILTPTKDRPEALELCRLYVRRQTYPAIHWVATGGTLAENLLSVLEQVSTPFVCIFEDDDHYKPGWVEWCVTKLQEGYDLVGERVSRYYHLPTGGYQEMNTMHRCSLCCTAFRAELVPLLSRICAKSTRSIDVQLWNEAKRENRKLAYNEGPFHVTGMKGLPGTPGMGIGHRAEWYKGGRDGKGRKVLRDWVGEEDAECYLRLLQEWNGRA